MFRNILVAVDFSDHATRALETALELAKQSKGRLHLIHSYPIPPVTPGPYEVSMPIDLERSVRAAADRLLDDLAARARSAGVPVETSTTPEFPAEAIVRCAEKIGADLIVMGTRGMTGLKHLLLGSVAERTLRLAPCPVLTLKVG
jgi:nucleotide-binding universal stress UspA family protein